MRTINSVLITANFSPTNMELLKKALAPAKISICSPKDSDAIVEALKTTDVAILPNDIDDRIMTGKHLKWIHCSHAGLTKSARNDVFNRGIILTGSAGRSAPALAEHAVMFMLALTYDLHGLHELQKEHKWGGLPGYSKRLGLFGKTIGIIGLGNTGSELAMRCKAFQMKVLGYRRSPEKVENVDVLYSRDRGDTIDTLLRESDFIVLCVNLSDATYHMIGREQLNIMKPSAYLINMGRGALINEDALIEALVNNAIAGAGLDTVTVEPLSSDSMLWDIKNVIITPHTTPAIPDREERSLRIILNNIEAYRNETPMMNLVTLRDIYTH